MIVRSKVVAEAPLVVVAARTLRHLGGRDFDQAASTALGTDAPTLIRAGLAGLTKQVSVHTLEPVYSAQRVVIPIRWVATGISGELFPVLDANLELHAAADDTTELVLVGSYRPPFGRAGAVADHVLMHRVAERTLHSFLDRVVEMVTATPMLERLPRVGDAMRLRIEPDT